MKFLHREAA